MLKTNNSEVNVRVQSVNTSHAIFPYLVTTNPGPGLCRTTTIKFTSLENRTGCFKYLQKYVVVVNYQRCWGSQSIDRFCQQTLGSFLRHFPFHNSKVHPTHVLEKKRRSMRSGHGCGSTHHLHPKRSLHDGQEHGLNDGHIAIDKIQKDKQT